MRSNARMLATLAVAVGLGALPSVAQGAFPGKNGKIAFVSERDGNREIYSMNPDGTDQTRLTTNAAEDRSPEWSPDGTKIAFTSDRNGNDEIYVMSGDGSSQTDVSNDPADDYGPAWSPDGGRIAFTSTRGGGYHLFSMGADGTDVSPPLTSAIGLSAWSPDGLAIALSDFDTGLQSSAIYTIAPDGSDRNLIAARDLADAPDWSPDSSRIVFDSDAVAFIVNRDGTGEAQLPGIGESPVWSPDGSKLAWVGFSAPLSGTEIFVSDLDGTGAVRLTQNSFADFHQDWQPIPGPNRSDYKNAAKYCKAQREFLGEASFEQRHGGGANAYGRCVSSN
jgi:Tol biopolymer transport system component